MKNGEVQTYACRIEHELESRRIKSARIPVENYSSEPDFWIHQKNRNHDHDDIFQTVIVDSNYRFMTLLTRKLAEGKKDEFEIVSRQTDMMNQQIANYPFICHNLGQ